MHVSYVCSLSVTWQRWRSHHPIHHGGKPLAVHKLHVSVVYRTEVIANRSFTLREYESFTFLAPVTLTLTFIYELDLYYLEIYCTCISELPTSRLSKVIIRQTDIQTCMKLYTMLLHGWLIMQCATHCQFCCICALNISCGVTDAAEHGVYCFYMMSINFLQQ